MVPRESEDHRRLSIILVCKTQVPLKYFWHIEVIGHLDIPGLKSSRIIRLFRDLAARSFWPSRASTLFSSVYILEGTEVSRVSLRSPHSVIPLNLLRYLILQERGSGSKLGNPNQFFSIFQ